MWQVKPLTPPAAKPCLRLSPRAISGQDRDDICFWLRFSNPCWDLWPIVPYMWSVPQFFIVHILIEPTPPAAIIKIEIEMWCACASCLEG